MRPCPAQPLAAATEAAAAATSKSLPATSVRILVVGGVGLGTGAAAHRQLLLSSLWHALCVEPDGLLWAFAETDFFTPLVYPRL